MPDIFISYSSKDREQAQLLTELLSSAGLSVWIDQSGIGVATSWSGEISKAITDCTALIVLLSPSSVDSKNVTREVALAFERNKKILPIDIEPVALPDDFAYHLADLQRSSMSNIDAIIRALGKLGLEATGTPQAPKIVKAQSDGRKSLMILPFEDLSPTGDNGWFADGIASELISALSNVKSLRVADPQATKEFKAYKGQLAVYAKEMSVQYFVQGDVRKFGDNIKITCRLLDMESGDFLWQDSLKGTMQDIFDIQEKVAEKVVEGLKVHLASDEKQKLAQRGTENAEAYELYLKASEYYDRHTRNDSARAMALYEQAILVDPYYAQAHAHIATTAHEIYRHYDRRSSLLDRADQAAEQVRQLKGETALYLWVTSHTMLARGELTQARERAERAILMKPDFAPAYDALGFALQALGDATGAVRARRENVRLRDNDRSTQFNLLLALHEAAHGDHGSEFLPELQAAAERAIPIFARHIRLNSDDYHARVHFVHILWFADKREDAMREAEALATVEALDGVACYNLACIFLSLDHLARGMEQLRRAVQKGYRNTDQFRHDPDLAPLRGTSEFESLMKELEAANA